MHASHRRLRLPRLPRQTGRDKVPPVGVRSRGWGKALPGGPPSPATPAAGRRQWPRAPHRRPRRRRPPRTEAAAIAAPSPAAPAPRRLGRGIPTAPVRVRPAARPRSGKQAVLPGNPGVNCVPLLQVCVNLFRINLTAMN